MPAQLAQGRSERASPAELPFRVEGLGGEGAGSRVYRAVWRATSRTVAIKVVRSSGPRERSDVDLEGELLARLDLRWGPGVLGAGVCPASVFADATDAGDANDASGANEAKEQEAARWVALTWAEGVSLDRVLEAREARSSEERVRLAAIVAHGVGRALEELHSLGLRHGDVKPANVVANGRCPTRDLADERGASLVDYGFASAEALRGVTPRYLAPEVAGGGVPLPDADLFALGVVLAEIVEPALRESANVTEALARADVSDPTRAPLAWAQALAGASPSGRPSAKWVADRAARFLGLGGGDEEARAGRVRAVIRGALAPRAAALGASMDVDASIGEPVRGWLLRAGARLAALGVAGGAVAPLTTLERTRWIVTLVGPQAAVWPLPELDEAALGRRLLDLALRMDLGSVTSRELEEPLEVAAHRRAARPSGGAAPVLDAERAVWLAREVAAAEPSPEAREELEELVARGECPLALSVGYAVMLLRRGELGLAHAALARHAKGLHGACDSESPPDRITAEACLVAAEIARRRGDPGEARALARAASRAPWSRDRGRALVARVAWDAGDLAGAAAEVAGVAGPFAAEVRGLCAYSGSHDGQDAHATKVAQEAACADLRRALAATRDGVSVARLEAVLGMLEHARGDAQASLEAYRHAAELAGREGALVEEASYATGMAAAAADAGDVATALGMGARAGFLWERFGQRGRAARAWLSRAAAYATIGAVHGAEEAAREAHKLAESTGDHLAAVYALWARVEVLQPGDARAERESLRADAILAVCDPADRRRVRSAARLLRFAPSSLSEARALACDEYANYTDIATRWEWWGARAFAVHARLSGLASLGAEVPSAGPAGERAPREVLGELLALLDEKAPVGSEGPAIHAAARLARELGHGDAARRFEARLSEVAARVRAGCPPELFGAVPEDHWARFRLAAGAFAELEPAQLTQLEGIVKSLASRDRLAPLLEQVLDALVLWTGVERGLLLLRAPNGRLVPRAARNLARRDLSGPQLALSMGLAKRALETGEAVVALDALSSHGDAHASVHALRLRSVLAVPLLARGEVLGVVYLDDRMKKGAFGPRELGWVKLLATQAAMAISDARDKVLLRRALRHEARAAERAKSSLGRAEAELVAARASLAASVETSALGIVGTSETLVAMLRVAVRVAASDVPVLVLGESGTGKELVARAIHARGARSGHLFVGENCASFPEPLLESTLFGHVKGAFTGASATRLGLFELAHKGTLFLDEIGEMSPGMQAKLLRVLQDGEVRPVGAERSRRVDVRVIGATHRDLAGMVRSGAFREDLYYRLNVVTLRVPALRERPADIPLLFAHFLAKYAPGRSVTVTRAAMARLTAYPWPGNVRQLENEVRRALVLADDRIDTPELSPEIGASAQAAGASGALTLRERLDTLETELVRAALEASGGNQTKAALELGVSRFGLQKMLKRLGIR